MKPEDYRDTWGPMPPVLWLRYPKNRAQATVCWYCLGGRKPFHAPPVFRMAPGHA